MCFIGSGNRSILHLNATLHQAKWVFQSSRQLQWKLSISSSVSMWGNLRIRSVVGRCEWMWIHTDPQICKLWIHMSPCGYAAWNAGMFAVRCAIFQNDLRCGAPLHCTANIPVEMLRLFAHAHCRSGQDEGGGDNKTAWRDLSLPLSISPCLSKYWIAAKASPRRDRVRKLSLFLSPSAALLVCAISQFFTRQNLNMQHPRGSFLGKLDGFCQV